MAPSTLWLAVYSTTGALQPLLVDRLRERGLAPKVLLGPMLANMLGMALVAPMREVFAAGGGSWAGTVRGCWRDVGVAIVLDFWSAALLCIALLSCGAAAFTLIYSSCALLVAVIGSCAGTALRSEQWVAVLLATAGIVGYELAASARGGGAGGGGGVFGVALACLGSLGHSAMFVYAEHALKRCARHALTPFRLSSLMGAVEALAIAAWIAAVVVAGGDDFALGDYALVLRAYAPLVLVDALHALSFFATLGEKGAVSASMLKGVQVLVVFAASNVLSCDPARGGAGCATPAKTAAVVVVVAALALFYARDPPKMARVVSESGLAATSSPPCSPPSPAAQAGRKAAALVV